MIYSISSVMMTSGYPLVHVYIALEHGPVESSCIFPIEKGVDLSSSLYVNDVNDVNQVGSIP